MSDEPAVLANLSQAAALVLDYLLRYREQKRAKLPQGYLGRSLSGTYPLFRYLFTTARFLDAPIAELERAGVFDGQLVLDPKQSERVRQSAKEYIRVQDAEILSRIPFSKIWEVVGSSGDDDNVDWLIERLKFRDLCDLRPAVSLSKQHADALLEIGAGQAKAKKGLIDSLAERVGMQRLDLPPTQELSELPFGLYQAADLVQNSNFRAAIALLNGNGDGEHQLAAADRFAETYRVDNVVFLLLGSNSGMERRLGDFVAHRRAVILGDSELKRIGLSADPKETMRECIFPQLPPGTVSPFRSRGPVTGNGFFGRRAELQRIARIPNAVLLGARRIGKTSLLQALRDEVNGPSGRDGMIAVFVEAGSNRRLEWFQKNLMQAIIEEAGRANVEIRWIDPSEAYFEELATALRKSNRKYLFLIDEVDHLLQDPKVGLFEEFVRSMANRGHARFVLSGYMTLRNRTENRESFLYNLFTPIVLGPLNERDAEDLVRTQMKRIYVKFESDEVVKGILEWGTTFAAYVQSMCELLLKRLDEPLRQRCITSADVHAVYQSEKFAKEIVSAVTVNAEQALGPLERLILYWAAARDEDQFTAKDLIEDLRWLKFNDALASLSYLTETYLLVETQGKYRFYTSHLKSKLREVGGIDFALARLIKEYRES